MLRYQTLEGGANSLEYQGILEFKTHGPSLEILDGGGGKMTTMEDI
jgi:hypothetical protein